MTLGQQKIQFVTVTHADVRHPQSDHEAYFMVDETYDVYITSIGHRQTLVEFDDGSVAYLLNESFVSLSDH